jgi:hypothetical protein
MMHNLSIDAKNGRYRPVVDDLRVEEQKYDGSFFCKCYRRWTRRL